MDTVFRSRKDYAGTCPELGRLRLHQDRSESKEFQKMTRLPVIGLICILTAGIQLKAAEDFEKSYVLVPGRHIVIDNKMGDVKVSGYEGEDIKVIARKEGPDREKIEIVERSFGPQVMLFPKYPKFKSTKTKVDFELKVPKSDKMVSLILKSGSGKIEVRDFSGGLVAESSRGEIKFENVAGFIDARSVSGNLDAEIQQSKGRSQMRFNSMSGDIKITAPPELEALVAMHSRSGDLETDFPIDIREGRYREHTARGKLGSGKQMIHISSVSGNVSLKKK
jgi:hypothetical protein